MQTEFVLIANSLIANRSRGTVDLDGDNIVIKQNPEKQGSVGTVDLGSDDKIVISGHFETALLKTQQQLSASVSQLQSLKSDPSKVFVIELLSAAMTLKQIADAMVSRRDEASALKKGDLISKNDVEFFRSAYVRIS